MLMADDDGGDDAKIKKERKKNAHAAPNASLCGGGAPSAARAHLPSWPLFFSPPNPTVSPPVSVSPACVGTLLPTPWRRWVSSGNDAIIIIIVRGVRIHDKNNTTPWYIYISDVHLAATLVATRAPSGVSACETPSS